MGLCLSNACSDGGIKGWCYEEYFAPSLMLGSWINAIESEASHGFRLKEEAFSSHNVTCLANGAQGIGLSMQCCSFPWVLLFHCSILPSHLGHWLDIYEVYYISLMASVSLWIAVWASCSHKSPDVRTNQALVPPIHLLPCSKAWTQQSCLKESLGFFPCGKC